MPQFETPIVGRDCTMSIWATGQAANSLVALDRLRLVVAKHATATKAAEELGVARSTLRRRLDQALGEDGGSIRVSTRIEGDCAQVEVADDGPGMEPATAERIFEPFFTTKDVGKGTGLGLSISQQIVEAHGGSVAVETAPGAGTRFRIRLPLRSGRIGSLPPEDL